MNIWIYFSQGSALLDITSGGNMSDYFRTTYKFMDLSPHVLIPMHGRVNMWPKHMLCGYLKNRRNRESTILKAIKGGGKTLFDIVAYTYADVDSNLWLPAASNVRLHVDHLAQQDKFPKVALVYLSSLIFACPILHTLFFMSYFAFLYVYAFVLCKL
ncbi:endoribonuclease LACTB2 isoform X2 [Olea europaea subsp. europaea]|uniref:Endoribonuclease LACTB2 isoform X2 n=1 Tax=Olea europaea subsp. europaea TaxID=158383 RepID=A0A8S0VG22_OLEEU|nr:endoribonuclease LACTB2 isoform X2 [Olea europaea subsp. europaea]